MGQGANSQFGKTLPTDLPSGQIFASIVQAFGIALEDALGEALLVASIVGEGIIDGEIDIIGV